MGLHDTTINLDGSDEDLKLAMQKWSNEGDWKIMPSKQFCMEIASKLPNSSYAELIDNTERIRKYLEERI